METASRPEASPGTMTMRRDWAVPQVELPEVDMLDLQGRAVRNGHTTLPYAGLPREWVGQAIDVALMFHPDRVYLFGSTVREQDTDRSDIDLLVAFDGMPVEVWDRWEREIRYVARFFCPYPVNAFVTDVEDLTRMRRLVVSPCMWAQEDGRLVFDKGPRLPVMTAPAGINHEVAEEWLRRAAWRHATALRGLGETGDTKEAVRDFASAAELALKAVFIELGCVFPRTHRVGELIDKCPERTAISLLRGYSERFVKQFSRNYRAPCLRVRPVPSEDVEQCRRFAGSVLSWAEGVIRT